MVQGESDASEFWLDSGRIVAEFHRRDAWQGRHVDLRHIAFRGTQPAVLDLMGGQIAALQDMIDGMASLYLEPLPTSPAQLAGMLKADTERWGPLVKAVGFTPEG